MATYTLGSSALLGINKAGTLKPDADGWYDVYLGALEFPNSYGATYDLQSAQQILNGDNVFIRRLKQGRLFGELGHPRRLPGMTEKEFHARLLDILETNESHSIKEITIDTTAKDKNGRNFIAFRGKVKPSGPHREVLVQKFSDPNMNACFSIRSFARDEYQNGKIRKYLGIIVTFDLVGEPGIDVADKYNAPGLESHEVSIRPEDVADLYANRKQYGLESADNSAMVKEMEVFVSHRQKLGHVQESINDKPNWLNRW